MNVEACAAFGVLGVLSGLIWGSAAGLCLASLRRPRREVRYLGALALALAGLVLARVNSGRVSDIKLDRSEETRLAMEAARRSVQANAQNQTQDGEIRVRFAEDSPGEVENDRFATGIRPDLGTAAPAGAAEPEYRKGGKQKRVVSAETNAASPFSFGKAAAPKADSRTLKQRELLFVNRLDRLNLLLSKLLFIGVLGLLVGDYARRFNRTFDSYPPLPLAGPWLDALSPKCRALLWIGPRREAVQAFLCRAAAKRETFIYFGEAQAVPEDRLFRVRIGRQSFWPLPVLRFADPGCPADAEFALDAAWFGRYAVVVPASRSAAALEAMAALLRDRHVARAASRRTLYLIWDQGDVLPPARALRLLASAGTEMNVKPVIVSASMPGPETARWFDEVVGAEAPA